MQPRCRCVPGRTVKSYTIAVAPRSPCMRAYASKANASWKAYPHRCCCGAARRSERHVSAGGRAAGGGGEGPTLKISTYTVRRRRRRRNAPKKLVAAASDRQCAFGVRLSRTCSTTARLGRLHTHTHTQTVLNCHVPIEQSDFIVEFRFYRRKKKIFQFQSAFVLRSRCDGDVNVSAKALPPGKRENGIENCFFFFLENFDGENREENAQSSLLFISR